MVTSVSPDLWDVPSRRKAGGAPSPARGVAGQPPKSVSEGLTRVGGVSPLLKVVPGRGEAADLMSDAQLTPGRAPPRERKSAKLYETRHVSAVAASAIGSGLTFVSPVRGDWDIAGGCTNSRPIEMLGATPGARGRGPLYGLTMHVRCRRCAWCLRRRGGLWAHRAVEEMSGPGRTWMATFTASPANHYMLRVRASARLRSRAVDFDSLPARERFAELAMEFGAELTKYWKRLRKNTGAKFRYILVAERHKSGLPHFHALIHEQPGPAQLRHATLTAGFGLGYTKFKLCQGVKAAWYVTKYLTKSAEARIRASLHYGSPSRGKEITVSSPRAIWPVIPPPHQRQSPELMLVANHEGTEGDQCSPSSPPRTDAAETADAHPCPAAKAGSPASIWGPARSSGSAVRPPDASGTASGSVCSSDAPIPRPKPHPDPDPLRQPRDRHWSQRPRLLPDAPEWLRWACGEWTVSRP